METGDALSPALEALVARFATLVRSVGARHGLSEADLDELMQSVRLRIWRARSSSEQISSTSTSYVYRTAVSAALDLIRARRKREESIDEVPEREEHRLGSIPSPEGDVAMADLTNAVALAVDAVTPSRRPVLRMYLAGYEREEIAALLGWSEAKTRNLLYRGLADLRAALEAQGIGPGAPA